MRYKVLIFIVLFCIIVLVTMEVHKNFENMVLNVSDKIRVFFISNAQSISLWYEKYFSQAKEIEILRTKVADYEKIQLQNIALTNQNNELKLLIQNDLRTQPEFYLSYVSAYVRMGEYDRVWLTLDSQLKSRLQNQNELRIFGLVRNNVAVGIAKFEHNRLQGFFNNSQGCSYSVFIGENKAPGILDSSFKSSNEAYVSVVYIPKFMDIKVGDEVYTNGLDGIFLENIAVGKVMNIYEESHYLRVDVLPYAQTLDVNYVWVIDTKTQDLQDIDLP